MTPRRAGCKHDWRATPGTGLIVVLHCPHCGATVLDAMQALMIRSWREQQLRVRWIQKVRAQRKAAAVLRERLDMAEAMADRIQVLVAENYSLRKRLAALERRAGVA